MSVVYNGDHSIDFWNLNYQEALCVNSWDDLHLIPASRPYVANPEVLLQSVSIPNTNRRIDMTGSLTEGRTYNSRQGEWEFIIDHDKWPDWATCYRHLVQYFHGFKMAARLKDHDLERMYKGRIIVQSYAPNNDYSRIVLRYIFESGKVTDYGDLNLVFNVAWVDWSGGLYFQSKYSWNDTPSYPGAPSGVTFEPSISSVKSNQIYREANADDEPVRIEVVNPPDKIQYDYNESLDYSGMKVAAFTKTGHRYTENGRYPNGIIPIGELTISVTRAPKPDSSGKASIPVSWRGFSDSFKIDVEYSMPEYISIIVLPDNISYVQYETINYTGIKVQAFDKNGNVWKDESWSDEFIPYNKLTFPTTKAPAPSSGVKSIIPVEWKAPDNTVLETTFEINVGIIIYNKQYMSSTFSTFDGYNVVKISNSQAFAYCSNLTSVDFPVCSYVGIETFAYCSSLVSVSFPVCNYMNNGGFYNCSSLLSANFPVCSYVGSSAFRNCSSLVSVSFPTCISMGSHAFQNCSSLLSANFPVCSYVGSSAFRNCSSLVSVSFPVCSYVGSYAFLDCSSLISANFPVCSYVGAGAFSNCSSLISANFPVCSYVNSSAFHNCSSLVSVSFPVCSYIGSYAFQYCSSLVSVSFPVCSYVGDGGFYNCSSLLSVSFPVCSYVGAGAFSNCSSLLSVSFPVCSYVDNGAFYGCSSLVSVIFSACSYMSIYAFYGCSSLVFVSFPTCISMGSHAFQNCSSLVSASFPVCSYIGSEAFRGCSSLVSVSFPVCSYIGSEAFRGCSSLVSASFQVCSYVGSYAFRYCSSLLSANFPVCSYVGRSAFMGCSSLVSVSFPVCSYVGSYAFQICSSLVSASFPVCSYVGAEAFWGCSSLVSISFQVCSYVGNGAFQSCPSLQYLTIGGSSVISYNGGIGLGNTPMSAKRIYSSAISSYIYVPYPWTESNPIEFGSIYVPASLINDYMTASGWSAYSSRFAAI